MMNPVETSFSLLDLTEITTSFVLNSLHKAGLGHPELQRIALAQLASDPALAAALARIAVYDPALHPTISVTRN